jgi:dUTP pyrophosphatase
MSMARKKKSVDLSTISAPTFDAAIDSVLDQLDKASEETLSLKTTVPVEDPHPFSSQAGVDAYLASSGGLLLNNEPQLSTSSDTSEDITAMPIPEADEVHAAAANDDTDNDDDWSGHITESDWTDLPKAPRALKVKFLNPYARELSMKRATEGSAGLDLCACKQNCTRANRLYPGPAEIFPTGVCVEIPFGYFGLVTIRSGKNIKNGLQLSGGAYIIDSDYRGEIMLPLTTTNHLGTIIDPGDRVAQLVLVPVKYFPIVETDELSPSERGANGIGSTD